MNPNKVKLLVLAALCGLAYQLTEVREAVADVTHICLNGGSCERSNGVLKMIHGNNTYIISGSFGRKFALDGCDNHITKNGNPKYDGPYDDGKRDTVDMEGRCGKILGTKYYDDHTAKSPHYDKGEWKDGKKHGNITLVIGEKREYEVWKDDVYQGFWSGSGHGEGLYITAEEQRMYKRQIAAERKTRREAAARRSRKNKPASTSTNYEWIDKKSGEYKCRDVAVTHRMDFCNSMFKFFVT